MSIARISVVVTLLFVMVPATRAAEEPVDLSVGDKAPHFAGTTDENEQWKSEDVAGEKTLVVYFYPADMTGGCTRQACNYRDAMREFEEHDVEVVGISGDSAENHRHFKNEHDLNFTLLADTDGEIAKAFGVKTGSGGSVTANIAGRELKLDRGVTTARWTFVIDKDWKIAYKETLVNPGEDTEKVLAVVKELE